MGWGVGSRRTSFPSPSLSPSPPCSPISAHYPHFQFPPQQKPRWFMANLSASSRRLQSSGMLSREQLVQLFNRFSFLTSLPDAKKRIKDAVKDKQEAVAVTTTIQEEILLEMGIDPRFGIACLGKVNTIYENDRDLMIQFYRFVAKEELACDEAELEADEFAEKMYMQQYLQEQQLEMLKYIRKYSPDYQTLVLEKLHQQMESANFDNSAAVLTSEQIQEIVQKRVQAFANKGS